MGSGHTSNRVTIADALSHGDNVRDEVFPLQLEGPKVLAYSAKTNLDLIYDKEPSGLANMPVEDRWQTGLW